MNEAADTAIRETRWWWIRHAPVTSHTGRIYGQQDVAANFDGTEITIEALARVLPKEPVMVTSDLRRAKDTAERIATAGVKWSHNESEPAFREQHFGELQGLSTNAFADLYDSTRLSGWFAPAFVRPPGGESFADVIGRVAPAVIRRTAENSGHDVVAIAHGGSIRAAICFALGLDPGTALSFSLDNLSLTRLDHITTNGTTSVWRIVCINRLFG